MSMRSSARHFSGRALTCILLKGADLLSRLYGVRGTRPLSDVDLLVHEQDLPVIHRLLIEAGFIQQIDGNPAYRSSQSTLSLDLVSDLWYLDEEGLAALWDRARTRPLGQLTVKQLGSDDLLLYLIAYSVVHRGYLCPSFFTDLRLLIETGNNSLAHARLRRRVDGTLRSLSTMA